MSEVRHVVEVNEIAILACGRGAVWWEENVLSRPIVKRIEWVKACPAGGIAHIPCEDREEAEFVRDHMVNVGGISPKHVKAGKLTGATL